MSGGGPSGAPEKRPPAAELLLDNAERKRREARLADRADVHPQARAMDFFDSLSLCRLWISCQMSPLTMSPPEPALESKNTVSDNMT